MTDKERILMSIASSLRITQVLVHHAQSEKDFGDYTHWGVWDDRPIQKGDLVMCDTGNVCDWKIAWVHEVIAPDTCMLREIGSNRLCRWSNERFSRLVNMREGTVKSFGDNRFKTYYPDKFADYSELVCFGLTVYPLIFRTLDEARTHLESFIRDQMKTQS